MPNDHKDATEIAQRVRGFIEARESMGGPIDKTVIYKVGTGDGERTLFRDDVLALLDLADDDNTVLSSVGAGSSVINLWLASPGRHTRRIILTDKEALALIRQVASILEGWA